MCVQGEAGQSHVPCPPAEVLTYRFWHLPSALLARAVPSPTPACPCSPPPEPQPPSPFSAYLTWDPGILQKSSVVPNQGQEQKSNRADL